MKSSCRGKKVHKSVNFVHDLATLSAHNCTILAQNLERYDVISQTQWTKPGLYRYVTRTNVPFFDH